MIRETIAQIEKRLQNASSMSEQTRLELLGLLGTLRQEVTELSKTDADRAERIAGLADTTTEHATSSSPDPDSFKDSLDSFAGSVDGFENSHPNLVQIVNRICTTLSNLGI
ncbi:MAG TPA: DUF4404 family protein [Verrucomicrobiae bacterium]|jgi:hypothetical protein